MVEFDRHELSRSDSDGSAVDHDPSVAGDDGIDVVVAIIEVVVRHSLGPWR